MVDENVGLSEDEKRLHEILMNDNNCITIEKAIKNAEKKWKSEY